MATTVTKRSSRTTKHGASESEVPKRSEDYLIGALHLDLENPRFGGTAGKRLTERDLLNIIAEEHDISDVLSSISSNGYFHSEPLIGARNKAGKGITIVEGNRRLAACLILAGDPRAADQTSRRDLFLPSKFESRDKLPVFIYDWSSRSDRLQLLPYLGIRHIVGPLQWDSYAKAAWLASVLEEKILSVDQIVRMTADKNRTVVRLVDGYYFVNQLERSRAYDARTSNRRGRGSKSSYPFSWVYNALDHESIRQFVGLAPRERVPKPDPIPKESLDKAGELMVMLFGNDRRAAVIHDSRFIQELAVGISQKTVLKELRQGVPLDQAIERGRPPLDRVMRLLESAGDMASQSLSLLVDVSTNDTSDLLPASDRLFKAARSVRATLSRAIEADQGPGNGVE